MSVHSGPSQLYIFNLKDRRKSSHYLLHWALFRFSNNLYFFASISTMKTVVLPLILCSPGIGTLLPSLMVFGVLQLCIYSFWIVCTHLTCDISTTLLSRNAKAVGKIEQMLFALSPESREKNWQYIITLSGVIELSVVDPLEFIIFLTTTRSFLFWGLSAWMVVLLSWYLGSALLMMDLRLWS